jgi:hypothetical protein
MNPYENDDWTEANNYIKGLEDQNRQMKLTLSRILIWWDTNDKAYSDSMLADDIRKILAN